MRMHFKSTARPKLIAERLQDIFPLAKLFTAQLWAADLFGYSSWHEMEQVTKKGAQTPSPYDEDLPEADRLVRQRDLRERLVRILDFKDGLAQWNAERVMIAVAPTSKKVPARAASAPGKPLSKRPFYHLLHHSMMHQPDWSAALGAIRPHKDRRLVSELTSGQMQTFTMELNRTGGNLHPYDLVEQVSTILHYDPKSFGKVEISVENDESVMQASQHIAYVLDENDMPVGYVDLTAMLSANKANGDEDDISFTIDHAWAARDDSHTWDTLSEFVGRHFSTVTKNIESSLMGQRFYVNIFEILTESDMLIDFLDDCRKVALTHSRLTKKEIRLFVKFDDIDDILDQAEDIRSEESELVEIDCRNCGGSSFSVEGGPCPACKGSGKDYIRTVRTGLRR